MCICWFITYVITLFNAWPWNIIKLIHTVVVVVVVVVMVTTIRKITKHLTLEITLHVA
jgi:hypothetical protein